LYASGINPIPGPNEWPIDLDVDPIEPPILKKQCGRTRKLKKKKKKKYIMIMCQMKVLRSLTRGMMSAVETVVKRATTLGVTANQKIPIGRSIPKGLGTRSQLL